MVRTALIVVMLTLPWMCLMALAPADPTISPTIVSAAPLRFRLYDGYAIVVQVPAGDTRKTYNLMIDTGANPSVIDSQAAADLGLSGRKLRLALVNGTIATRLAELPPFTFGPIQHEPLRVLIRDLSFIRPQLGIRIDGILGMDVLAAQNLTIDYQHGELRFGTPAESAANTADFTSGPPFVTVTVNIDGQPLQMLVDTGNQGTLLFRTRTQQRLKNTRVLGDARGVNMAGRLSVEKLRLRQLRLGKTTLRNPPATLLDDNTQWGGAFDGLLGPAGLKLKRLSFDFEHRKLYWDR